MELILIKETLFSVHQALLWPTVESMAKYQIIHKLMGKCVSLHNVRHQTGIWPNLSLVLFSVGLKAQTLG